MLAFEEALERVLSGAERLGTERIALADAAGRVLAEPLVAEAPLPAFDYSAMDGYAIALTALVGDGPWRLPVVGESRTGIVPASLEPGAACRIFTGAEIPAGTDAVILQEDVERSGDHVVIRTRPAHGDHIRRRGEDIAVGAIALEAGTRLGPAQLGLAAALDRSHMVTARQPRVCVVCTGDELRPPGSPARPGTIPDSNGIAIASLAMTTGAVVTRAPLVGDQQTSTTRALENALAESDLVVTVGGVSVGDHDVVKSALQAAGAELGFWKVRIKPGKPLVFGATGKTRVLGLPGNPSSALVTFTLFGVPLLRALQGDRRPVPLLRRERLTAPIRQKPGRRGFYRGVRTAEGVAPLDNQASGAPTGMAWADVLIVVHEDSHGFAAGDEVPVLVLADV